MSINLYKLKKWTKMIFGKSIYHVHQDGGKIYSKDEIKGYYNNLTEKVIKNKDYGKEIPIIYTDNGNRVYFSIAIFQYGLGAYDLYLLQGDVVMIEKVKAVADWAVQNQQKDGSWVTFEFENPDHPYSSMAQGEGISILLRAYILTSNKSYLNAAHKAYQFMIKPLSEGGTAKYDLDDIYFYEYTEEPLILNGWIFSIWGIYDYYKITRDIKVKEILDKTLVTLTQTLGKFDSGYWSMYDLGGRITSPFYHNLHIAQLKVMYDLTGNDSFKFYHDKWLGYQNSKMKFIKSFCYKAYQKVME